MHSGIFREISVFCQRINTWQERQIRTGELYPELKNQHLQLYHAEERIELQDRDLFYASMLMAAVTSIASETTCIRYGRSVPGTFCPL